MYFESISRNNKFNQKHNMTCLLVFYLYLRFTFTIWVRTFKTTQLLNFSSYASFLIWSLKSSESKKIQMFCGYLATWLPISESNITETNHFSYREEVVSVSQSCPAVTLLVWSPSDGWCEDHVETHRHMTSASPRPWSSHSSHRIRHCRRWLEYSPHWHLLWRNSYLK